MTWKKKGKKKRRPGTGKGRGKGPRGKHTRKRMSMPQQKAWGEAKWNKERRGENKKGESIGL